jgi:hypothetical protein
VDGATEVDGAADVGDVVTSTSDTEGTGVSDTSDAVGAFVFPTTGDNELPSETKGVGSAVPRSTLQNRKKCEIQAGQEIEAIVQESTAAKTTTYVGGRTGGRIGLFGRTGAGFGRTGAGFGRTGAGFGRTGDGLLSGLLFGRGKGARGKGEPPGREIGPGRGNDGREIGPGRGNDPPSGRGRRATGAAGQPG